MGGQMLSTVEVGSSYGKGNFHKLSHELTALERSAFKKRMATALINCPRGTPFRKQNVAGQMALPAAVVNSCSYKQGLFHKLWLELE
jgi:hypothetical protein